jgi:hypothetical protein
MTPPENLMKTVVEADNIVVERIHQRPQIGISPCVRRRGP